jgi:hypothetical protein
MRLRSPIGCCLIVAVFCVWPALGQVTKEGEIFDPTFGRSTLAIDEPTTEGVWEGTWLYVNRDIKLALWLRGSEGIPEYKLRYHRVSGPQEDFETDWAGGAQYTSREGSGKFDLSITSGDENALQATWLWDLQFTDSGKTENANLSITRTGDGRQIVFMFEDYIISLWRGQAKQEIPVNQVWNFIKVSKRLVLWDELP